MQKNILVIEDEQEMLDLLNFILSEEGYTVNSYTCGEDALKNVKANKPDIVLLDLMLPGISGLEICRRLKNNSDTWMIPVIILTSRSDEFDILNGIEAGCDDYMTKPFSEKILLAKIKSILEKQEKSIQERKSVLKIKDLTIDANRYIVDIKGKIINLTASEFKLLYFLAKNINCVYTRDQIYEEVCEGEIYYNDRSIDILIARIRKKLGSYGKYIETIYGVGYKFSEIKNLNKV